MEELLFLAFLPTLFFKLVSLRLCRDMKWRLSLWFQGCLFLFCCLWLLMLVRNSMCAGLHGEWAELCLEKWEECLCLWMIGGPSDTQDRGMKTSSLMRKSCVGKNKYRLDTKEIIETCCLTNHLSKTDFWLKLQCGWSEWDKRLFLSWCFFFFCLAIADHLGKRRQQFNKYSMVTVACGACSWVWRVSAFSSM